jgi:hypothetical protein
MRLQPGSMPSFFRKDCRFRRRTSAAWLRSDRASGFGRVAHAEMGQQTNSEFDALTQSFVRLCNLPTYPLDRLSRSESCSRCNVSTVANPRRD